MLQLGESGGVVYSERIDHLVDSASKRFISLPVTGVMRLDEAGQIIHWRTTGICASCSMFPVGTGTGADVHDVASPTTVTKGPAAEDRGNTNSSARDAEDGARRLSQEHPQPIFGQTGVVEQR